MKASSIAAVLALLLAPLLASAANAAPTAANPKVILVNNGINKFTLGKYKMLAVRSQRDNGNAHGFEVVSFHEAGEQLNLVPLFSSERKPLGESYHLTVSGGADCVLHDFRLVKPEGKKPAQLILADRDLGESYADADTVRFTYYELVENGDDIGAPLYFAQKSKGVARRKFCDVNEAFDKELRLGPGSQAER
jgi:hypothetical protein